MLIKLSNIKKLFLTEEIQTAALNNISLDVNHGEFIAVMGPSGCGKSTLLNVVGMLDRFDEGSYLFDGVDVSSFNERELTLVRKRNLGFIFQSFNLIDELTIRENIALPLQYQEVRGEELKKRVDEVMDRLGISHRVNHRPHQLSGGQQQRVAIARALVSKPKLILADEPTGNLDSQRGEEVMSLLKELNLEGTSILMVTHSQDHAEHANRVIRLMDGKIQNQEPYFVPSEEAVAIS